jgi:SAM-dependent methyltransferase
MSLFNLANSFSRNANIFFSSVCNEYQKLDINFSFSKSKLHKEDPTESPDHYSVFAFWMTRKIHNIKQLRILDVGNTKYSNFFNSLDNDVTALVLKKPNDELSSVKWVICDVSDPLPFDDSSFDVFSAPSSLHLIGMGRYGDRINPLALLSLVSEINRVVKRNGKLYLMLPLGHDECIYGFHFIYSFESIKKIFNKWLITDYFVDEHVIFGSIKKKINTGIRFSKNIETSFFKSGDYKIIYLELTRA